MAPHTRQSLTEDLRSLGVEEGDALFMHSSFRSLGKVEGGAGSVIGALEDAVGPRGLLLLPSFNLFKKSNDERMAMWKHATTPSSVGWLTEYFRAMPGTVRTNNYSHSVAARGLGAEEYDGTLHGIGGLVSPWDRAPYGRTYGDSSPFMRAYNRPHSKLLMLGTDYKSATFCHLVEVWFWNKRMESNPKAVFQMVNREALGEWWDANGRLRRGRIGDSPSRLFGVRDFVDTLLDEVAREPQRWCKWWAPDPE